MDLGTTIIVKMSDIVFNESIRGRIDYGDIDDLAKSIKEQGLINPITVYSPTLQPPYELLAGGRRYKALKLLKATSVSVRIYDKELSDREKRVIELYENLKRKELSHIDRANMTSLIHQTLQAIHGTSLPGPGGEGHSTRNTAKLLGVSQQTVNNDIKIAQMHKNFPELALEDKKNASAALHTIERVEHAVKVRVTNPKIELAPLAECYQVGNFFSASVPEAQFSFIEIDPPYAIDLDTIKKRKDKGDSQGYEEVEIPDYVVFTSKFIRKCTLAAAPDAYLVLWTPPQWYQLFYTTLTDFGWDVDHVPALWYKVGSTGQTRVPEHWLGGVHEPFLYARRGTARIAREGRSNVFTYPVVHSSKKVHPTERPYHLMQDIINTFCLPGSSILVPFAGSGVTIAVAYDLGHEVVGYDTNAAAKQDFLTKFVGGE